MKAVTFPAATAQSRSSSLGTLVTLIGHRLRAQVRPMLAWGLALGLLNTLSVAIFPSFEQSSLDLNAIFSDMPPQMVAIFGLESGFSTIKGYLAARSYNFFVPLILAFFPILLGAYTVAGAEDGRRLDTLLSNPLPRWQLIVGSFVTLALGLLGVLALLALLTWLPAAMLNIDLPFADVAAASVNIWPLGLFAGALALLCSSLLRRNALAIAIPGGLLVAMYFVDALGELSRALEPLQPLTVFHYYGSAIEHGIVWPDFLGVTLAALVLAGLAVLAFQRRDIYT